MTDAVTPNEDKSEENKSQLAKIEPVKKTDLHEVRDSDNSDVEILPSSVAKIELEKSLLYTTRSLLRQFGIRKSTAAVRDAVEMPHETFEPAQAVSALSYLGFKASFGSIKMKNITDDFFPFIAFKKNGEASLVKLANSSDQIEYVDDFRKETSKIDKSKFNDI